jgi:phage host-nuclease inhibitor protein Gam
MPRIKTPVLATREAFDATVADCVRLRQEIDLLNAREAKATQRVVAAFSLKREPLETALKAQASLAEKYADAHRDELLPVKDRKSADIGPATIGYRTGNPATKTLSKKWTWDAVLAALKLHELDAYIATKEDVAKAKILADRTADETLGVEVLTNAKGKPVALAVVGIRIDQDECFYIEPKATTTATIKAEAA